MLACAYEKYTYFVTNLIDGTLTGPYPIQLKQIQLKLQTLEHVELWKIEASVQPLNTIKNAKISELKHDLMK